MAVVKKRWVVGKKCFEYRKDVEAFLDALEGICNRHGMSLSHEDSQGAFLITDLNRDDMDWIRSANDARAE